MTVTLIHAAVIMLEFVKGKLKQFSTAVLACEYKDSLHDYQDSFTDRASNDIEGIR